ncbi:MAG: RidA family protein [Epsilonproteobacteria bacterium]|nr:MAG: RidA family protein [Campylobacterota bacterium]RLA67942.1 MAG: RidA family protein [Campylobacterota bacterium]
MEFKKEIIDCKEAPQAVGTYSQGVVFNGVYYFSGQIGIKPKTGHLAEGVLDQIKQILENIDTILGSQNLKRENIIKTTVFLTDLGNFSSVNEEYKIYFEKPYPARSCVEVSALPKDALVEIEVIAATNNV